MHTFCYTRLPTKCIYLQINQAIIDETQVQSVILGTYEKVSLKITYEFSTFTTDQLVELVNYEEALTTIGSFSIDGHPQLFVFESTSMYVYTECILHRFTS